MSSLFFTLMIVAMILTLVSLAVGVILMGKGGEANLAHSQKLMKARVILQGITLGFFALALLTA